ncbi:CCR4-NOT transcription complex subunit 3 isoform X2 [Nematostella vectensis]|uniref:CCR4-NOT transcription complex subunit 3 isoform X2 n=1 Tax=Nematostella vectensis TaxID=45351 RepID=UPI00207734C4|nr:CCR4-NOT transcription complex subunit 3 isoform X2 [Nematostella vectensis]
MADKRKLQGEIERCLKKVSEGVETFEDIWQKVHNATNANQKEKYEADLKKEIKKLQRLRDQIKTWVASNDIKDKRTLLDNRKLIEQQMERFKVVERETKTKAYSKEGLGLATKIDPATKEKEEARQWITDVLDRLKLEIDQFESEIELVIAGSKKKKLDKERQDRVDELNDWAEKHRFHNQQLEMILRMLDNGTIECDDVSGQLEEIKQLKDDMDYYLECCREPDFQENEFMYDDFDLDADLDQDILATSPTEDDDIMNHIPTSPTSSLPPTSPTETVPMVIPTKIPNSSPRKNSKEAKTSSNSLSGTTPPRSTPKMNVPTSLQALASSAANPVIVKSSSTISKPASGLVNSFENHISTNGEETSPVRKSPPPTTPPPPVSGYAVVAGSQQNHVESTPPRMVNHNPTATTGSNSFPRSGSINNDHTQQNNHLTETSQALEKLGSSIASLSIAPAPSIATAAPISQLPSQPVHMSSINPVLSSKPEPSQPTPPSSIATSQPAVSVPSGMSPALIGSLGTTPGSTPLPPPLLSNSTSSKPPMSLAESLAASTQPVSSLISSVHLMTAPAQRHITTSDSFSSLKSIAAQAVATASLGNPMQGPTGFSTENRGLFESVATSSDSKPPVETNTAHLQPLLGVAPLGPVPLNKERRYQLGMLEAAYHHLPQATDSERVRPCLSRNPYPAPHYHHQQPPSHLDAIEFFQRLSPETLFFIFYYQEGTRAQYLAAKALKKQSWRFHTKYMMWFQRHEEPKAITDEYEQGTYIYFDYEKWGQRKKEGFTFEYRYLEDKDLP